MEIEVIGEDPEELLLDVHCCGTGKSIKDGCDDFVELVCINTFDFCTIDYNQDRVEDDAAYYGLD